MSLQAVTTGEGRLAETHASSLVLERMEGLPERDRVVKGKAVSTLF